VKWLISSLIVLLLLLQYRLWVGDGSVYAFFQLREEARATHKELLQLRSRNQALEAEVADLKSGLDAIEEKARTELGMIDEDETFYQFVKRQSEVEEENTLPEDNEAVPNVLPDADGSAAGRPLGSDGEVLLAPNATDESSEADDNSASGN